MGLSQSGFVLAMMLAGFVLWLAAKGRLSVYASIVGL
jgi:hypothetical protein